jgi:membrane fusion protein, multidrug efflux system
VPVVIGTAVDKDVPVELKAIGAVEAYSTVSINARVGGELLEVHFREGQDVQKGDLLFEIDPRPYQTALDQAAANLARDRAQLKNFEDDVNRYRELVKKEYVTQERYDQILTASEAQKATVMADEAALEDARLNLGYCTIRAPIAGRTGSLLVHAGNLIKANGDQPLVVINQVQPVCVSFSLPEQHLAQIRKYEAGQTLRVTASIPNSGLGSAEGDLSFVDNAVDGQTGTIKLKGTFPNADKALWPGQFVNVALILTTQPRAVVIPSQAVLTGQAGDYVYVVGPDSTVEVRTVVPGTRLDDTLVIEDGLKAGEKVVTDGQLRLAPGARVVEKQAVAAGGENRP